ncbi:hypothetical protein ACFQ88_37230 [Paenibacillus sp. NPDC056579]|uniref:hypothetical protein n=1 Tax=unclassified Paenibacillus TaxID=185978 RepID=UPI001EF8DC31|nr:hypothetical protein [Paenibacillus sp. H1-7]ULL18678.1 hypothetical protein DVH26_32045 [Paenibacillus sp. H1-7]
MKHITPINEQSCREHYGKPVLVVLRDGSELVATLSRMDKNKIMLNGEEEQPSITFGLNSRKSSTRSGKNKTKSRASVKTYTQPEFEPGFGPNGRGLALDVSSVALMFSLT